MIQANELRIGNYVLYNNKCIRITHLLPKWDSISNSYINLDFDKIKPLPLTKKHLLGFGFSKRDDGKYWLDNSYIYLNSIGSWDFMPYGVDEYCVKINSVHQLQNSFPDLMRYELVLSTVPVSSLSEQ